MGNSSRGQGLLKSMSIEPPGGKWGPDRFWVLSRLMAFYQAEYQVSGPDSKRGYCL